MTPEEQIRLYRLMEKLNWFFHQEMHYLDRDIAEKTARECYPEIRDLYYDILWNDLPEGTQEQLMNEEIPGESREEICLWKKRLLFIPVWVF